MLIEETAVLEQLWASELEPAPGSGKLGAAAVRVLQQLRDGGDQTVPQLARGLQVSRQHVQTVVNRLLAQDQVQTAVNPAHCRSPLLQLTAAGAGLLDELERDRADRLRLLEPKIEPTEVFAAVQQLRRVRRALQQPADP